MTQSIGNISLTFAYRQKLRFQTRSRVEVNRVMMLIPFFTIICRISLNGRKRKIIALWQAIISAFCDIFSDKQRWVGVWMLCPSCTRAKPARDRSGPRRCQSVHPNLPPLNDRLRMSTITISSLSRRELSVCVFIRSSWDSRHTRRRGCPPIQTGRVSWQHNDYTLCGMGHDRSVVWEFGTRIHLNDTLLLQHSSGFSIAIIEFQGRDRGHLEISGPSSAWRSCYSSLCVLINTNMD